MTENRLIRGNDLIVAICEAIGLESNRVRRIIIDAQVNDAIRICVDEFGDNRLLQVKWDNFRFLEIERVDK